MKTTYWIATGILFIGVFLNTCCLHIENDRINSTEKHLTTIQQQINELNNFINSRKDTTIIQVNLPQTKVINQIHK